MLANDLYKPIYERASGNTLSDRGLTAASRISVLIVGGAALLIGIFYANMYDLLVVAFQMLFQVLFFPLILGVYWQRANAPALPLPRGFRQRLQILYSWRRRDVLGHRKTPLC